MPKQIKRDPVEQLEGTGGGGTLGSSAPVKVQKLPYMGEKSKERISPPEPRGSRLAENFGDTGHRDYAKGGKVGSASKRADGCAQRGKTRGKMV